MKHRNSMTTAAAGNNPVSYRSLNQPSCGSRPANLGNPQCDTLTKRSPWSHQAQPITIPHRLDVAIR